jgi:hypothetical protein
MTDTIRAALDAAAKRLCICDGECFETRHGMMHGPCERKMGKTAAAVAAFLRALPNNAAATLHDASAGAITSRPGIGQTVSWWAGHLAAAVEEAAKEAGNEQANRRLLGAAGRHGKAAPVVAGCQRAPSMSIRSSQAERNN